MKIVLLGLVILMSASSANALTCGSTMVRSACGSGKVSIAIDRARGTFTLENGDVECWFADSIKAAGQAKVIGDLYPYYQTTTFLLQRPDPRDPLLTQDFAKLHFDETQMKARLELQVQQPGILSSKYDLDCEGLLKLI